MKNAIQYYYQLVSNDIHQNGKEYRFTVDNESYVFMPYERNPNDMNDLYQLALLLFQRHIYCHQFVLNVNQQAITVINQIPYVLLKIYVDEKNIVTQNDLILFYNGTIQIEAKESLKRNHWYHLWTQKLDYFEYQINQFGKKYPIVRESFSYFDGLAETAILMFQRMKLEEPMPLSVAHQRIHIGDTHFEFYNPLYFVIDYRVRDVAEYFKTKFFRGMDILEEIEYYIQYSGLSVSELQLFFIRLLYPSYYFDIYEDVIDGIIAEENLVKILKRIPDYEKTLKQIYLYLRSYIALPELEWIIKT